MYIYTIINFKNKKRMKLVTLAVVSIMIGGTTFGQLDAIEKDLKAAAKGSKDSTSLWEKGGTLNINATQVSLNNWAGGGQNSVSLQGILGLYANYSKGKSAWDNSLDLAYGLIRQGGQNALWLKNDDRIELNSKFGHKASKHWYYAGLLNFRTQFVYGYSNTSGQVENRYISNFLAPAYTTFALGMDYKPNTKFSMFASPATIKVTAVLDDSLSNIGAFGVEEGLTSSVRTELGGYLKAAFIEPKVFGNENLSFKTALSLFTNYQESPQNIDVTWDASLTAKVAKYFTVSLSTNLIYDHDIDIARKDADGSPIYVLKDDGTPYLTAAGTPIVKTGPITQFKEVLAVGFAYKF
jgi:hypothetical protein